MSTGFEHLSEMIKDKVIADFGRFINEDGSWDFQRFNRHNDYQRHLFALFLKIAGFSEEDIKIRLFSLCDDIVSNKVDSYLDDIVHSVIVGIPNEVGRLLPAYYQVAEV